MTENPLIFFDIESTGTDVSRDRIVTLYARKIGHPSIKDWPHDKPLPIQGEPTTSCPKCRVIYPARFEICPKCPNQIDVKCNPGFAMSDEVIAVHGITNEAVKEWPSFQSQANDVYQFFHGCDLAGFNITNFDVPLLHEELFRSGIDWDLTGANIIDVGSLFKIKESRDLASAVKFYCWREHSGAHSAESDVLATIEVFKAQLAQYPDLPKDRKELALFSQYSEQRIDLAGKLIMKDGRPCYNFGNKKGTPVLNDPGFGHWMLTKDFTEDTKRAVRDILFGNQGQKEMRF